MALRDLVAKYDRDRLYVKERRQFIDRKVTSNRYKLVPNTTLIRPKKRDRLFGGRKGALDTSQGTFGYFYGGGWTFGLVEHSQFRVTADSFAPFKDNDRRQLTFRAGNVSGELWRKLDWSPDKKLPALANIPDDKYMQVSVDLNLTKQSEKPPVWADLRPMDKFAFDHDLELRQNDEKSWVDPTYKGSDADKAAFNAANAKLLERLKGLDWTRDLEELRDERKNLSKADFERMSSLMAYERTLSMFTIFALGLIVDKRAAKAVAAITPPDKVSRFALRQAQKGLKSDPSEGPRQVERELRAQRQMYDKLRQTAESAVTKQTGNTHD